MILTAFSQRPSINETALTNNVKNVLGYALSGPTPINSVIHKKVKNCDQSENNDHLYNMRISLMRQIVSLIKFFGAFCRVWYSPVNIMITYPK